MGFCIRTFVVVVVNPVCPHGQDNSLIIHCGAEVVENRDHLDIMACSDVRASFKSPETHRDLSQRTGHDMHVA